MARLKVMRFFCISSNIIIANFDTSVSGGYRVFKVSS